MKVKCKVCGEMIEHIMVLEHAATKHKDIDAMKALSEIKRLTSEQDRSYEEVVDELGVKWMIMGRDMLDKVAIRSDLKMIHIWTNGGLFQVETSKISARLGVSAEIENLDR